VVVSTAEFHYKAMAAAATLSTIPRLATTLLSNNRGVLKMVITKIPSPFPLLVGSLLRQVQAALHAGRPRHLRAPTATPKEDRHTRSRAIPNPKVKLTMPPAVAPRAMEASRIEEKMEIRTGDSETRTADAGEPHLDSCSSKKGPAWGVGASRFANGGLPLHIVRCICL